jgi:ammonia channel protein AmtB
MGFTKARIQRTRRGLVSIGFLASRDAVAAAYPNTPLVDWGVFYGGSGAQLGIQILGASVIAATTVVLNGIGFGVLRALGCLRVPKEVQTLLVL